MIDIDRLCPGCMNDNGAEKICSICGTDVSHQNDDAHLPVKFMLSERYVIGKALSTNAEGVTYIAWDTASDSAVHIKEYYPKGISVRNPDKTVSVTSGNEFYFNEGLMDFIEINKKLIATELQSVIPVLTVFEENGTVYAATPIVSGITLNRFLDKNGGSLRWEQARPLFLPLIDTLKALHEEGILHGGISPETIIVGRDGKLRFSSICIPRLRTANSSGFAELYSGYAAAEQYGKLEEKMSEASDVYALSAVLFRVIIGIVPPSAEARLVQDTLSIPARFADELPRQVLVAMANGMQVNVQNRTANVDTFKNELVYGETQENIRRAANNRTTVKPVNEPEGKKSSKSSGNSVKYAAISASVTAAIFLVIAIVLCIVFKDKIFGSDELMFHNSEIASMPDIDSIGEVDPGAAESVILYDVPNLAGKYFYQLEDEEDYERFKFVIKGKEFSDKYERGMICAQSVAAGTSVQNETEIQITISLGPKELAIANVVGLDEMSAKLELLKQGFLYENIVVEEMYDSESAPGVVLRQTPEYKETVNAEVMVTIYINSYEGEVNEPGSDNENDYVYGSDDRYN